MPGIPEAWATRKRDARLFASWGVDFLKYDYCGAPDDQQVARERYGAMGQALRNTGRDIVFSVCEWGSRAPHLWGAEVGGHMWRVTGDVFDSWVDVAVTDADVPWTGLGIDSVLDLAAEVADYAGPGRWNDLDMLVVGLAGQGQIPGLGLSYEEYRTQLTMWAMACSPLMIGCDVRALDTPTQDLLSRRAVLAVNQDALGVAAKRVRRTGSSELWCKSLAGGSVAVALVNRGSTATDVELRARDAGVLDGSCSVVDLWEGAELGPLGRSRTFSVQPHQALLLELGRG